MKAARLQVDPEQIDADDKPPQTGHTFNVWYLQWAGGDPSQRNHVKLRFKVDIAKDSGYTRAAPGSPICLFFARGCCYKGKKCRFLHRLPEETDPVRSVQDCFGRDKTADYKDDMSGVGLFRRVNSTLYVGGLHVSSHTEEVLGRHFGEFGQIEKIRVLHGKGCAFVKFRLESQAQFAKEAMQAQSLDGNDVLDVKWANEDPNPEAQKSAKRDLEQQALETVRELLKNTPHETEESVDVPEDAPDVPEETEETEENKENGGLLGLERIRLLKQLREKKASEPKRKKQKQSNGLLSLLGYSSD